MKSKSMIGIIGSNTSNAKKTTNNYCHPKCLYLQVLSLLLLVCNRPLLDLTLCFSKYKEFSGWLNLFSLQRQPFPKQKLHNHTQLIQQQLFREGNMSGWRHRREGLRLLKSCSKTEKTIPHIGFKMRWGSDFRG